MIHIILNIPHITNDVFLYLSLHDLYSSVLVCKDWNTILTPLLWRNPSYSSSIELSTLFRHQNFIKNSSRLDLSPKIFCSLHMRWSFSNLRDFRFRQPETDPALTEEKLIDCLKWLQVLKNLETLDILLNIYSQRIHNTFIATLQSLSNLDTLICEVLCEIPLSDRQEIIFKHCSHLSKLVMRLPNTIDYTLKDYMKTPSLSPSSQPPELDFPKIGIATNLEIKSLQYYFNDHPNDTDEISTFIQILMHCHRLESLHLPSIRSSSVKSLVSLFLNGYCPNLQRLYFTAINKHMDNSSIINSLRERGKRHDKNQISDHPFSMLKLLSFSPWMSAGKGFLESIVGCNALTDLDLGIAISIYSFSGLMRKLPNLRSMAVQVQLWIKGNYKKEFAKNAEWMCLGLTNFEISIRAEHGLVASRATRGARLEKYINYLFKNIGRCSGLKKLHLEFGFENLFDPLRFSFVDHLSELKQLEQFKILRISNKGGLQEGRWMVKNWPRLASVIVYDLGANRVFEECLRRERPDLELSRYDEFYGGPRIFTT